MKKYIYDYLTKKAFATPSIKHIFLVPILVLGFSLVSIAQMPTNFQDNIYAFGFNGVNGITFDANGKMYAWEKEGRVHIRNTDGSWSLWIDISEEIDPVGDHGLKGFVLDPNFLTNGYFYMMYEVDRHHLLYYGTSEYDPNANGWAQATIGRITRYTAEVSTNFTTVDSASRFVLLGRGFTDGIPIIHETHGVGSLLFGTDGTLIASCGESSTYNGTDPGDAPDTYYQQALEDGILQHDNLNTPNINENDNVGSWRAQMKTSLSGKIIRIDPATGNGISSNPFYDTLAPRSAASRVWALGLRNPFRIALKPNTGEHSPAIGNPGVIYVGDVGSYLREESNVVTAGGQNFGWPRFEGVVEQIDAVAQYPYNREQEFSQSFAHKRPAFDYRGANTPALAYVNDTIREIGTSLPDAIPSISLVGNSSTAGIFYQGNNFPEIYKGQYFYGDFGGQWLHSFTMNTTDELLRVDSFQPNAPTITCIAENPINGYLYYVSYAGTIREIKYDVGNQPPKAVASQSVQYGVKPLNVQFDGSASTDPENGTISYLWDFGDGSPTASIVNPAHIFIPPTDAPTSFNVTLTVTDSLGQTNSTTLLVSVNNTPPKIDSTNIDRLYTFDNTIPFPLYLQSYVTDTETASNLLQYKWEPILHHDNHIHPESVSFNRFSSTNISPLPCDGHLYYYEIKLTVTDLQGLSSTVSHNIYPACIGIDAEVPSISANLAVSEITATSLLLNWGSSTDNFAVAYYEIYQDGVKISTSQSPSFLVKGLQAGTTYIYTIKAKDASGNVSLSSNSVSVTTTIIAVATQDEIIYGDALNPNWQNFSSISSLDIANTSPPFINTKSIKITNPISDETLDFRKNAALHVADFPHGIEFWVYNEGNTPFPLQVQTFETNNGGGGNIITVMADPKKWVHYVLEWNLFGSPTQIGKVVIKLNQSQAESLYFDEIKLLYCADMQSVKTGNWNDTSVWSCGRIPIVTDTVTINTEHTVTIANGQSATLNLLYLLGTLNKEVGSVLNINNY